jgi:hypothetical protein
VARESPEDSSLTTLGSGFSGLSVSQTMLITRQRPFSRTSVKKLTPRPWRRSVGESQLNS